VINSSTTGTTTIKAKTDVTVNTVLLHRETGDGKLGDSIDATKLWADDTVRTDIHNPAHAVITAANAGDVVHDKVFVARTAGTPAAVVANPTGNVIFHRYATIGCTGASVDETVALAADGTAESGNFTATADMSYQAHYNGDSNYPAHDGACEPLTVVQLTPTVTTDIHSGPGANDTASANPITNAQPGDTVHDKATVTGSGATPTGTVTFTVYLGNTTCSGTGTDAGTVTLVNGVAHPSNDATAPDGGLSYKAHYNGGGLYAAADGPCEPLPTALACPAGGFTGALNPSSGDFTIVYDQFPAPNDNSYGVNAVGWGTGGHTFGNLTGSDKSGYEVVNPSGTIVLDFFIDYITSTTPSATFPSGYRSLGPFGGDGAVNVGTLTTTDLTWDTSFSRNLNKLGYFSLVGTTPTQRADTLLVANNGTNLLVNSPATLNTTDSYTLKTPNVWNGAITYTENGRTVNGWDFHDTFFVTLKQSKLAAIGAISFVSGQWQLNPGWKIQPDLTGLHNSPAKACPVSSTNALSVTKRETRDKQVKITILNSGSTDAILTELKLAWPQAVNGNLLQIKLDGDVLYSSTTGLASPQDLVVPPLTSDSTKRKINHASSDVLYLIFKNNVDPDLSHYTGTASFGATDLTILP
jgi:hypothetical protein